MWRVLALATWCVAAVAAVACPSDCDCPNWWQLLDVCRTDTSDFITVKGTPWFQIEVHCEEHESRMSCVDSLNVQFDHRGDIEDFTMSCRTSQLSCLPPKLNTTGVYRILLYDPPAPPTADHVRGMELKLLYISNANRLRSVPTDALSIQPELEMLQIEKAQLTLVPDAFRGAVALDILRLHDSSIREVPAGTFRGLAKLTYLSLLNNKIESIENGSFEGLDGLMILEMNNNQIKTLAPGAFAHTPLLGILYMQHHNLKEIHSGLFTGEQLLIIQLSKCEQNLTLHSRAFADLPTLIRLELESCGVRSLPADVFRGSRNMTRLWMNKNQLEDLPDDVFQDQAKLRHIQLNENKITELRESVFAKLKRLYSLELSKNQIKVLPNLASPSPPLKRATLQLNENKLTSLTVGNINYLSQFTTADLKNNSISTIKLDDVGATDPSKTEDEVSHFSEILLDKNPFICDCELYPLTLWTHGGTSTLPARLEVGSGTCASPEVKKGRLVASLSPEELACP